MTCGWRVPSGAARGGRPPQLHAHQLPAALLPGGEGRGEALVIAKWGGPLHSIHLPSQEGLKSLDPEMFERCHFFDSVFSMMLMQTMRVEMSAKEREAAYQEIIAPGPAKRWTKRAHSPSL